MKSLWKGRIQFGPVDIPVKLYTAIADVAIHSRLLHDQDLQPLEQRMVCPEEETVVGPEEIAKGYEINTGEYVVLEPDELDFMEPEGSRQIKVMQFVKKHEVDDRYLDRTYYLGPDTDHQLYINFMRSLKDTNMSGVCQWVMRKKSYLGILQLSNGILSLVTHRYATEIEAETSFKPEKTQISDKEIRIAKNLVAELEDKFAPEQYKDDYQAKLQKLVDSKAKGKKVELPALEKIDETEDEKLLEALEKSLQSVKQK
jgi:DNA end-binding protein Ku